jgi:hypothetical protein
MRRVVDLGNDALYVTSGVSKSQCVTRISPEAPQGLSRGRRRCARRLALALFKPLTHKKAQRPRGGKPEPPCTHRPGENARLY